MSFSDFDELTLEGLKEAMELATQLRFDVSSLSDKKAYLALNTGLIGMAASARPTHPESRIVKSIIYRRRWMRECGIRLAYHAALAEHGSVVLRRYVFKFSR